MGRVLGVLTPFQRLVSKMDAEYYVDESLCLLDIGLQLLVVLVSELGVRLRAFGRLFVGVPDLQRVLFEKIVSVPRIVDEHLSQDL